MKTKEIIIDTVKKLVEQKDLQEISVQKICDEAGVSKGTFYAYFKDKYDVIHVFYKDFLEKNHILSGDNIFFDENMYYENQKKIISFIKQNQPLMKSLFKSNYQNSFLDFWDKELNPKSYDAKLKKYELEDSLKMNYIIYGIIHGQTDLLKRWIMDGCMLPEEDLVSLLMSMESILKLYKK